MRGGTECGVVELKKENIFLKNILFPLCPILLRGKERQKGGH